MWLKPAATALIPPLAWELLYAVGVALKSKKKKYLIETKKLGNPKQYKHKKSTPRYTTGKAKTQRQNLLKQHEKNNT